MLLTAYDDDERIFQGMRAGAAAYCSKDIEPEGLFDAIRQAARSRYVIRGKALDQHGLQQWLTSAPGANPLCLRRLDVLWCVARGLRDKEIASELRIGHQTVKNHITSILKKPGVHDRTQAAVHALERGWTGSPPRSR